MKVLICGAGIACAELLKRVDDFWTITLVDISRSKLEDFSTRFHCIAKVVHGDASSPVTMEDADLSGHDFVMALTSSDKVNLALCKLAQAQDFKHVLSFVQDPEQLPAFQELGVRTLAPAQQLGRQMHHYLQDPRISIVPIGKDIGELMEVDVAPHLWIIGKTVGQFLGHKWRIVALVRDNNLLLPDPDTVIESEDRLLVLGPSDIFRPICSLMDCAQPHFPLSYGQSLLLALPDDEHLDSAALWSESLHIVQKTKTDHMLVLSQREDDVLQHKLNGWSHSLDVKFQKTRDKLLPSVQRLCSEQSVGLVMLPTLSASFFQALLKPTLISLAHSLPCPVLISRQTHPYKKILVPFSGTPRAELALEIAIDLAQQGHGEVTVLVVREPEFLHGSEESEDQDWLQHLLHRVRELAHVHKLPLKELVLDGNPVLQTVEAAKDFDLLVLGSTRQDKGLFSPHIGENITQKSTCSVLIVTG